MDNDSMEVPYLNRLHLYISNMYEYMKKRPARIEKRQYSWKTILFPYRKETIFMENDSISV